MSGFELLVLALWADGTMGGLISLLLSPSQRAGQLRWRVAGFARERDAFLPLSLELLESHPGFPKLGQQGSRLHACCRFARALAEAQLGLGTGGCMYAACTGGLGSLFQPGHSCQGPTEVPSALTLTWHMPIAPAACQPPEPVLSPPHSALPGTAGCGPADAMADR